jgi:hypothetical protein
VCFLTLGLISGVKQQLEILQIGRPSRSGTSDAFRRLPPSIPFDNGDAMTITIRARTAVLTLALLCVLAGLAVGQLAQAQSASRNYQLSEITRELQKINRSLGTTYGVSGVNGKLDQIEKSTEGTCRAVDGFGC